MARFKNSLIRKIAAAVAALSITLTPRIADSYNAGDLSNPPTSFSVHPLLVEPLREAYHQHFPQSQIDFFTSEIQVGSIKEDSAPTYARAFHHFLQWQTGEGFKGTFSSPDQWAQDCNAQTSALEGNHCWDKVKEDFSKQVSPLLGENFGFWYHLNADLTVPAHVWDDAHPPGEKYVGGLAHMTGAYSDPYETWTDAHKDEIMGQVQPDLGNLPDTKKLNSLSALMKDLATFTGSNFYSADGLDGREPDNCTWDDYRTYCYRDITDTSGRVVQSNVKILHSGFFTDYPDSECFKEYWPILSAKVIEYGIAGIQLLFDQTTTCTADCYDRECGNDGCGGSCGDCSSELFCSPKGKCLEDCIADCSSKVCGNDGCDGSCGSCDYGYNCSNGSCTVDCGSDSCGGDCGDCPPNVACINGQCENCTSECTVPEKTCSGNSILGCQYITSTCSKWGSPQECAPDYNCKSGKCVYDPGCIPDCGGKSCGSNGCDGNCGTCESGQTCQNGNCITNCISNDHKVCSGNKLYWSDSCNKLEQVISNCGADKLCCADEYSGCLGGACLVKSCCYEDSDPSVCWVNDLGDGSSIYIQIIQECGGDPCSNGKCISCTPNCSGKECGDNGCGGTCGSCDSGYSCKNGACKVDECSPNNIVCLGTKLICTGPAMIIEDCADSGLKCSGGACISSICNCDTNSDTYCASTYSYYLCKDWNGNGCLEQKIVNCSTDSYPCNNTDLCVSGCSCTGKECGSPTGCTNSCGSCNTGYSCQSGSCVNIKCLSDNDCQIGYLCKKTEGECAKAGGSLCSGGSCTSVGIGVYDSGSISDDSFGLEIVGSFYGETPSGGSKNWNISMNSNQSYQMLLYGVGIPDGVGTYTINLTNATFVNGPDLTSSTSASGDTLTGGQSFSWTIKTK